MITALVVLAVLYILFGIALTAFCVHMSYHETVDGRAQIQEAKAQQTLESSSGILWMALLCVLWPIALLISFALARKDLENERP